MMTFQCKVRLNRVYNVKTNGRVLRCRGLEVGGGVGHVSLGAISEGEERHWTLQSRFFFEKIGITFYPFLFSSWCFQISFILQPYLPEEMIQMGGSQLVLLIIFCLWGSFPRAKKKVGR